MGAEGIGLVAAALLQRSYADVIVHMLKPRRNHNGEEWDSKRIKYVD